MELLRSVKHQMSCRDVVILYGQPESSPIVAMTRPEDNFDEVADSVGQVLP